jgi:uncharacterized membrane protein
MQQLLSAFFLFAVPAYACIGCGQAQSFNTKILLVGAGFVLLPVGFVAYIGWRLWKDSKHRQSQTPPSP